MKVTLATGNVIAADRLLMAAGPQPVIDGLILQNARVLVDQCGRIVTDRHLATSAPGVYAAGDMTGLMPFTTPPTPWAGGRSWPATSSSAGCCPWACRLPPVWRSPCCTAAALRLRLLSSPAGYVTAAAAGGALLYVIIEYEIAPLWNTKIVNFTPQVPFFLSHLLFGRRSGRVGVLETRARPLQRRVPASVPLAAG